MGTPIHHFPFQKWKKRKKEKELLDLNSLHTQGKHSVTNPSILYLLTHEYTMKLKSITLQKLAIEWIIRVSVVAH